MHVAPSFGSVRFSCPNCGALAHQYWHSIYARKLKKDETPFRPDLNKVKSAIEGISDSEADVDLDVLQSFMRRGRLEVFLSDTTQDLYCREVFSLDISVCDSCNEVSIWLRNKLVYPFTGQLGQANQDMPAVVRDLFEEAGSVFQASPRSSAALLRLALQHLLVELGEGGQNINVDINSLFEKGLSPDLTKLMHAVRIVGNESVHPGEISVDDDPEIARALFGLLNEIVEQLISRPKRQDELWGRLSKSKTEAVEQKISK